MFVLKVRRDGTVSDVTVAVTTKSELLDKEAKSALRKWRFKPGRFARIAVPVNFALEKSQEPRTTGRLPSTGNGVVLVDVDYDTGKVTAARMLESTGDSRLDKAAVQDFLKSRFKPKTVQHVRIPVTFTMR